MIIKTYVSSSNFYLDLVSTLPISEITELFFSTNSGVG